MLRRLQPQGLTIVVSTPYMDDAKLCDRIALIKNGRFIGVDTPDNIIAGFGRPLWSAKGKAMFALLGGLRSFPLVDNCYVAGGVHHFTVKDGFTESGLMGFLCDLAHEDVRLAEISPDIDDRYMQLANS